MLNADAVAREGSPHRAESTPLTPAFAEGYGGQPSHRILSEGLVRPARLELATSWFVG
jgi:hypothetical protein